MRVACLFLLSIGLLFYVVPASDGRQAPSSPALESAAAVVAAGDAERGRYLVEQVIMCAECHSSRDERGVILPEARFRGGPIPVRPSWARSWALRAPRIAGLPSYSDYEALRLFTQGAIGRNGQRLQPPMPRFQMTPEDAADVIAYIRSLP